jgi:hypothetical protein
MKSHMAKKDHILRIFLLHFCAFACENTFILERRTMTESKWTCAICLDNPQDSENMVQRSLRCGHSFHIKCLTKWDPLFEKPCLLCRREQSSTIVEVLQRVEECLQNHQWEQGFHQIEIANKKAKNENDVKSVRSQLEKLQDAWIASKKCLQLFL